MSGRRPGTGGKPRFYSRPGRQIRTSASALAVRKGWPGRPDRATLQHRARLLVDDAHRIARERGGNILTILKQAVEKG